MKCIKNTLSKDIEYLKVEIFSDLHIGSKKCDYKAIQERIRKVQADKNTYCIILGDLMNNSTKTSVGDVYEEAYTPMQQINHCVEMFRPIKDKILGVTSGNHERRSYKTDGIDLTHFFCSELGISDKYDYCSCLLFLRLGTEARHPKEGKNSRYVFYSIYMTHGDGQGGRTMGGKANGLHRRGQIVDADIVITGHTHAPMSFRDKCFVIDSKNNCVVEKEQLFINASATLDYEEYAELYGMKPSSKVSPVIILSGTRKEATVVI